MMEMMTLDVGGDGIATLLWRMPDGSPNVLSRAALAELVAMVDSIAGDEAIRGVIVASGHAMFCAGADLNLITGFFDSSAEQVWAALAPGMAALRRLESCGKPVVAAIAGHALGGGFELALACHARIVADDPRIRLGLPEAGLGLIPGLGGTQRLPRIADWRKVVPEMVKGTTWSPAEALARKAVTAVVPAADLMAAARHWIAANPAAQQPWDLRGWTSPAAQPGFEAFFTDLNAGIARTTWGNLPAQRLVAEAVYHGLQMPIDPALRRELRLFVEITRDPSARAMVRTNFFSMKDARAGKRRPAAPAFAIRRLGVIGGGLMGGGIAYQAAKSGLDVVLLEVDEAAALRGRAYSERLLDKAIERGLGTDADKAAHLARILPTTDYAALADCDLVIEAVFEDAAVKHDVLAKAEAAMRPDAVLASNTSTIPIGQLAPVRQRPDRFLGLHFFSPVEKMALLEIIRGAATSDATLAAGFDLARIMGKTPIAVRDGRAFFTTRVVVGYMLEGMAMLAEGVAPALIDNAGRIAGMPMGPLRLTDMVNIDLIERIEAQTEADLGADYIPNPGRPVGQALLAAGRKGEKAGAGFYGYGAEGPQLWPGLTGLFPPAEVQPEAADLARRLMLRQAAETLRCFDDGVLTSAADADVGSVLGWGFAPHTGGVAGYVDRVGAATLLDWCEQAERAHGPRFAPAARLRALAATGASIFD